MTILPNTTGAFAFVLVSDKYKPYISTRVVTAWRIDKFDGHDEVEPIFSTEHIQDDDIVVGYYHSQSKSLEMIDRVTAYVFDGDNAFYDAKSIVQEHYDLEMP